MVSVRSASVAPTSQVRSSAMLIHYVLPIVGECENGLISMSHFAKIAQVFQTV